MVDSKLLVHVGDIVGAHVSSHKVSAQDVPQLIKTVYKGLAALNRSGMASGDNVTPKPAMTFRASVRPDSVGCLECGKRFRSLRKHLIVHDLTPDQYRAKWSLPASYSMVSAEYSARRSGLAKASGFWKVTM